MKHPHNVLEIAKLNPDFLGFIFYDKSPRFVGEMLSTPMPGETKKIGVFVNENTENIMKIVQSHALDGVQLHGQESAAECAELHAKGLVIIKAFNVAQATDFEQTKQYERAVDFFLFDTKTPAHGGSGKKFDWSILQHYHGKTPFFLSGGIGEHDAEELQKLNLPKLYAVDINSNFEVEPGLKDSQKVESFITKIRQHAIAD